MTPLATHETEAKLRVGVDVGGTKVAVLVAHAGQEIARLVHPTRLDSPEQTLIGISDTIRDALTLAGAGTGDVDAVGVGIPGRVDPEQGIAELAVNLNWHHMPAGPALEQVLGVPCFLENDVRMAALGVKYHPQFAEANDLAYFSVGTGIAAGIILEGQLYRGRNGMAGEIGHISAPGVENRCLCGAVGCLETVAAGPGIERQMADTLASKFPHLSVPSYSSRQIFEMMGEGTGPVQDVACEVTARVGRYLGWAIKVLVFTYDLSLIVMGGGVARAGRPFLQVILQEIERQRQESDLAHAMLRPDMIQLLPVEFDAPLWGGIALAETGLKKSIASFRR